MKIIDLTCPQCGANIEPDMEHGTGICKYCGYQMLFEKEETLEEIAAKAQSKSYGYHKGKLQAEAEIAREAHKEQKRGIFIPIIVGLILVFLVVGGRVISHLSKPQVNPFDCIEISFRGTDGDGEVLIKRIGTESVDPNRIQYDISKSVDLRQGESISIKADSSEYRLTDTMKTYVVDGLDEYLKDLKDVSAEALQLICQEAEAVQELNLSHTKSNFFVDMKPVKLYLLTDGELKNKLYVVHEVEFDTEEGKRICYVSTVFENVVKRKDVLASQIGGYYEGDFAEVDSPTYITGFETVEAAKAHFHNRMEQSMEFQEMDI